MGCITPPLLVRLRLDHTDDAMAARRDILRATSHPVISRITAPIAMIHSFRLPFILFTSLSSRRDARDHRSELASPLRCARALPFCERPIAPLDEEALGRGNHEALGLQPLRDLLRRRSRQPGRLVEARI